MFWNDAPFYTLSNRFEADSILNPTLQFKLQIWTLPPAWQLTSTLNLQTLGAALGLCGYFGHCGTQATLSWPSTVRLGATCTVWLRTSSGETKRHWRKWLKKPRIMTTHKLQLLTSINRIMTDQFLHRYLQNKEKIMDCWIQNLIEYYLHIGYNFAFFNFLSPSNFC